jgi:hypothetical protein
MKHNKYSIPTRARLLGLLTGLAIFTTLASATDEFEWNDWFDPSATVVFSATAYEGPGEGAGRYESLEITRGPIVAGTCTITPKVITDYNDLRSMRFMVADDDNDNGHIENEEWTVVGTATITTASGVMTAAVAPTIVSATKDAYCIEIDSVEDGIHRHVSAAGSLTYEPQ